jgi:hypothetical protein
MSSPQLDAERYENDISNWPVKKAARVIWPGISPVKFTGHCLATVIKWVILEGRVHPES